MKLLFHLLTVILFFLHNGVSGVETDEVSVMEGDSVTIYTNVTIAQEKEEIILYFNKTKIANITRCMREIYIDAECKERFRDRLKLDHQAVSLTIRDIRTTDSGEYELQIRNLSYDKTFNVIVNGVSAKQDKRNTMSVKEGESVTLDPGQIKIPFDLMRWHFNEILITEITGDQSKICTDVQCDERFRDRLKLDNQTGSLTITNTRTADAGVYKLLNKNSIFSIIRPFSVVVVAVPDSCVSTLCICDAVGCFLLVVSNVVLAVVLAVVIAVVICYYKNKLNPNAHPNEMPLLERNRNEAREAGEDGEARDGEAHDGEARDGEAHDGEAHDGEAHEAGEAREDGVDGEARDGEARDGEAHDGEAHEAGEAREDGVDGEVNLCLIQDKVSSSGVRKIK